MIFCFLRLRGKNWQGNVWKSMGIVIKDITGKADIQKDNVKSG